MKVVYLAGPMSGHENYNHDAFMDAKAELRHLGYYVITPFEANSRVWQRLYGIPFNPRADRCDWGDPRLKEMFIEDVTVILREADAVAMMSGWEYSMGAGMEHQIADLFDIPILYEDLNWEEQYHATD